MNKACVFLNNLDFLINNKKLVNSDSISKRILCLPLFDDLKTNELNIIVTTINEST